MSLDGLPTLFSSYIRRDDAAVLVCTHNDADHANGILGFLKSGYLRCNEVWLPALWFDRLADLIEKPHGFIQELARDIREWDRPEGSTDPYEDTIAERMGDLFPTKVDSHDSKESTDDGPAHSLETRFEDSDYESDLLCSDRYSMVDIWHHIFSQGERIDIFSDAMYAATRIREIAVICLHENIPIRWFRYNPHGGTGGIQDSLVPLNASQVSPIPVDRTALEYIALSKVNKLSLTFCSPPGERFSGVVFTADSDLCFSG